MRILVMGASGRTGRRVLAAAERRGVPTAAFVRSRASLDDLAGARDVYVGDVCDHEAVTRAMHEEDIVISTLGGTRGDPGSAMSDGMRAIVDAMVRRGARRVLAVSGAGVLQFDATSERHAQPSYPPAFRAVGREHQKMRDVLAQSDRSWLLVCTPRLLDGDATGRLVHLRDYLPGGTDEVTTGDVAELLVTEALTPTFERVRLGVNTRAE